MSRRDTIIIAVLVNAALLMVLFVTAIRWDHSKQDKILRSQDIVLAENISNRKAHEDDLLNEYVVAIPPLKETNRDRLFTFEDGELVLAPVPPSSNHPQAIELLPSPALAKAIDAPKALQEETLVNITVKKGDFLEKIAKANHTTVSTIMKVNNLSTTQLKIGQVLKVPLPDGKLEGKNIALSSSTSHSLPLEGEFYTVREGDNPWLIASRNKINLEELLRLNDLDEQKAKRLRPGDRLKIR